MASLLFFVMGPALAGVSCCWPLEAMGVEKVQVDGMRVGPKQRICKLGCLCLI